MNVLETYSERLVQGLERRKTRLPYGLVWCLLGLAGAFFVFGLVDRTWAYLVEGSIAFVAAVILFLTEACWRRITELKMFLSEYVKTERENSMGSGTIESVPASSAAEAPCVLLAD